MDRRLEYWFVLMAANSQEESIPANPGYDHAGVRIVPGDDSAACRCWVPRGVDGWEITARLVWRETENLAVLDRDKYEHPHGEYLTRTTCDQSRI